MEPPSVEDIDDADIVAQDPPTRLDLQTLLFRTSDGEEEINDFEGAKVLHSLALFDAWTPQPSPCCAAAVVAGALNALASSKNWRPSDVLPYYLAMTDKRIATQKKKLLAMLSREALTEGALDALTVSLREKLQTFHGTSFGDTSKKARQSNKLTKTLVLGVARECLQDNTLAVPASAKKALFPTDQEAPRDAESTDELAEEPPDDNSAPRGAGGVRFDIPFDDRKRRKSDTPRWKQCQQELYQYWHLIDGRDKLSHPTRPSTAICGNAALLFALEAIAEQEPTRLFGSILDSLHAELFVGRPPGKVVCRISGTDDSDETREGVWQQLWTAFESDHTVLVYHMKNHYALIFALREWRSTDGEAHRELLTARRGQRPSCWVSWCEAYDTMAAWHGYKILRVTSVIDTKISV